MSNIYTNGVYSFSLNFMGTFRYETPLRSGGGISPARMFTCIDGTISLGAPRRESLSSLIFTNSSSFIQSLSEQVLEKFKDNGIRNSKIEGADSSEWKLIDGIDLIVHIFHPEKRKFYELEKMWSELIPKEKLII